MRHTVSTRTRNRPRFGNHTCQPATLSSALALTVALTLSACGGGGGGTDSSSGSASAPGNPASPSTPSTPLAPSTPTSSLAQGRWVSSGVTPAYSVVTVPASTGANTPALDTVWALAQDASTLIKTHGQRCWTDAWCGYRQCLYLGHKHGAHSQFRQLLGAKVPPAARR
ncbi:MAG: hypothetical protein IPJ18_19805 [Betaproteobacteria bacterium]|nr:hypothetical protein [Betaproteobacteria bacterium]